MYMYIHVHVHEILPFQQLQDIPKILKHKKDAIAFERSGRNVTYIQELPASVHDRLSPDYRVKMNQLLKHLLKLDAQERMNFPEFFEFVEDLVTSKIEVINLLQGTSGKIIYEGGMTYAISVLCLIMMCALHALFLLY